MTRQNGELVVVAWIALAPVAITAGTASNAESAVREQEQSLRPTDDRLEVLVKAAIAADPMVESFEIVVTVVDGAVRLNGTVDTEDERARAGSIAADIEGVTEVDNELTVEETLVSPERSDDEIRRIILEKASEALPDESFDVRVVDGFATLTGVVSSRDARRELTEIAFRGGALLVKNEVRIEHD